MHCDQKKPGGQTKSANCVAQLEGALRTGDQNSTSISGDSVSGISLSKTSRRSYPDFVKEFRDTAWLTGGAAVLNADGGILAANDALASWCGTSPTQLQGRSLAELLGQRHAEWNAPVQALLLRKSPFDRLELVSNDPDTSEWLNLDSCFHGNSNVVRMESVRPPLQELRRSVSEGCCECIVGHSTLQQLVRGEAQIDNLFRHWSGIVFNQRPDLSFIFISPRIEESTGVTLGEWKSNPDCFRHVVHEGDLEQLLAKLEIGAQSKVELTNTYRIRHTKTGQLTYIHEHRRPLHADSGELLGYEGFWLDITRQTVAERRLLNTSWKENMSTLTMGLVHDFCNLMTGIVSLSETHESSLEENSLLRNGLTLIRNGAVQAAQLAQRIRQLHQGTPGEKNYHDLNEIASSMTEVLQKVLSKRVRIEAALNSKPLPVYLDAVELRQVIVNLALNAVDAMPNGGQIEIRTSRHKQSPVLEHLQGKLPDPPLVCLSVKDTGHGIPQHLLNSIFDPFFTTKPLGKGSGLGLYNTRAFAEKHAAAVSVESVENSGTTFHVWFVETDFAETKTEQSPEPPVRHTLLAIGSQGRTMDSMVDMLRQNGYAIHPVTSDDHALEQLQSPDFHFTGVLLFSHDAGKENQTFIHRLRAAKIPVKTVCVIAGDQDQVHNSFIEQVDAVLPADLHVRTFLDRLQEVLKKP